MGSRRFAWGPVVAFVLLGGAALAQDLHELALQDAAPALRERLEAGADPDARDAEGRTPLMVAATENRVEAIEVLIEYGADLDARSESGRTALMLATQAPLPFAPETVDLLLRAGADPSLRTAEGASARELAERTGRSELVPRLEAWEVLRHALGPGPLFHVRWVRTDTTVYAAAVTAERDVALVRGIPGGAEVVLRSSGHAGLREHLRDAGLLGRFTPTLVELADPNRDGVPDLLLGGGCECHSAVLLALLDGASGMALSVSAIPFGDFEVPRNAFVFPPDVPDDLRGFLEGVLAREPYSTPHEADADYVRHARFTPGGP